MRINRFRLTMRFLAATLALGAAAACAFSAFPVVSPPRVPGYRLVPPLEPAARQAVDERMRAIDQIPADVFEPHAFRASNGVEIKYRLLRPLNAAPGARYPLIVVLHGSGEIGTDNLKHVSVFPKAWARPALRRDYPAFVLVPQMPARSVNYTGPPGMTGRASYPMPPLHATLELIDTLRATLAIDAERVYAVGFSMGGSSVWNALHLRPDLFAAAIPVAGVPNPAHTETVARTPVWIHHGNRDAANPIEPDREFYRILQATPGARVSFWEYDREGHFVPPELLAGDAFTRWLFAHRKPQGGR